MHIEILKTGSDIPVAFRSEMRLAGGELGRVRPATGTRRGLAADTVRPVLPTDAPQPSGPALMVQVDGQTIVEAAGFHGGLGVVLEGGGWMPAAEAAEQPADEQPIPSFFGQTTNDRAPLLGGTAEAGSLVLVGVGDAVFCVTADGEGGWTLDTGVAVPMSGKFDLGSDGSKNLLVTSIDAAGNSSGIAGVFVLRTRTPAPPILWSVTASSATPLLAGWAEPGCTVMVGAGGAIYCTSPGADGCWRVDTAHVLPASGKLNLGADGSKNVVLACTDVAGNSSTSEARFMLNASAAMPAPPAVKLVEPDHRAASVPLLSSVADVTKTVLAAFAARRERQPERRRG